MPAAVAPERLVTERPVLRQWRPDDAIPLAAINADPEAMRWIGPGDVLDVAGTEA